jgi:hypothetical protein
MTEITHQVEIKYLKFVVTIFILPIEHRNVFSYKYCSGLSIYLLRESKYKKERRKDTKERFFVKFQRFRLTRLI